MNLKELVNDVENYDKLSILDLYLGDNELNEALITFGNKRPKYNNVVILAGGAGSGKGYVKDTLLGIDGKSLDVDEVKKLALASKKFSHRVKEEIGVELSKLNLKNPANVSKLHGIIEDYEIIDNKNKRLFKSIAAGNQNFKPNIIFDVTLKDITKLHNLSRDIVDMGYDKKNIHIVWVVNDINVAMKQNRERDRVVPEDILLDTHKGAAATMKEIVSMGTGIKKYMDGDIWFAFNKIGVDATIVTKDDNGNKIEKKGTDIKENINNEVLEEKAFYIKKANYIKVKSQGKPIIEMSAITKEIQHKIAQYTPELPQWKDPEKE